MEEGTTIVWTNQDYATHTVTSNTGLFNSGDMTNGKTFSYKFSDAGTYAYYCKYHQAMGMTGTVVVQ
ncbi:MAG: cupredoxin domain-containing protein [Bacteroidetes bacterium]|nr:cupredoxin domain-containing protein [Bacteroidota bacterium]